MPDRVEAPRQGEDAGRASPEADRTRPAGWAEAAPDGAFPEERHSAGEGARTEPHTQRRAGSEAPNATASHPGAPGSGTWSRPAVWAAAILVLVLAAGGGWYVWKGRAGGSGGREQAQGGGQKPPATVPVEAAEARTADVPVYYDGLGTVQAFNNVTVRSRVDGEVIRIAFTEGQMVKAGDVLAEVDPRTYQAALDQALAKKQQDEASLASNKADLARTQQLASREFATRQQLDQQTAAVGSTTAQIAADQAQIDNARTQLSYATIRAPISGRTGLRLVDQGNIVRAGDTTGIVEIAQLQPISVLFTAPESQLPEVAAAKRESDVRVLALGSDGKTVLARGVLALINNEVDPASGTVKLKATFPNEDEKLWPGLSVNTRLLVRTLKGAVTIPEAAVQRGQNELFAFVIGDGDKVDKRTLKVGPFSGGVAVIEEGLKPGERVVTAGQSRLQPGIKVDIRDDKTKADPAKTADNRAATGDAEKARAR